MESAYERHKREGTRETVCCFGSRSGARCRSAAVIACTERDGGIHPMAVWCERHRLKCSGHPHVSFSPSPSVERGAQEVV